MEALRIEAKSKEEERLKEEAKKEKELKEKADEDKKKKEEEERLKEEARKAEQLKRESELADTKVPEGKGQGKGTQQPEEGTEAYKCKAGETKTRGTCKVHALLPQHTSFAPEETLFGIICS